MGLCCFFFFLSLWCQALTSKLKLVASCMERKRGHPQFGGFWSRTTISWHLLFTLYGFLVHSVSFVFTEDAQEITFHFLNTSVFRFSSKYGKTDTNHFDIVRAHLFREFKSSKGTTQLNQWAWCVYRPLLSRFTALCVLEHSVLQELFSPLKTKDHEFTVCLFAFSCYWFVLHLY